MKLTFLLVIFLLSGVYRHLDAQEDPVRIFSSSRVGLTHSTELPLVGELHLLINHRFGEIRSGLYDFFGLDLATIRLGFDYGITDNFSAGIGRSTTEKTYDIHLKRAFLKQSPEKSPVTLTGVIAASVNTLRDFFPPDENNLWGRSTLSAQLIAGRKEGILSMLAAPMLMRNNYELRADGGLTLFALPVAVSIEFTRRFYFTAEYIPVMNKPDYTGENPFSMGFDIRTSDHQFQLIFSNNRGLFNKDILTNTEGEWGKGKIYFGFNLVREFELKKTYQ